MPSRNLIRYLELVLATGILAFVYLPGLGEVEFHPDESQWIGTSGAFESFLRMEFDSSTWQPSYWTLTQPPVARYVIGLGRYAGGYRRPDLNRPWDFGRGRNYNEHKGALPSDGLLWWSRLPMAILAIGSMMIGFILLQKSAGTITSYMWLGLVSINPYFTLHLRRAMGESCLVFFAMLALYLDTRALELKLDTETAGKLKAFTLLVLAGLAGGLAWASKLNGVAVVAANIVIAIILAMKLNDNPKDRAIYTLWYGIVTSEVSLFVFAAINPFLWTSPIQRASMMFENRVEEMTVQTVDYSGSYMDPGQRVEIIPRRVLRDYASMQIPAALNFVLASVGVLISLHSLRAVFVKRDFTPGHAGLPIMAFFTAAPVWLSQLDWDRYYVFPVLFSTAFIAIACGWIIAVALRAGRRFLSRPPVGTSRTQ